VIRGNRGLAMADNNVNERAEMRAICEILARVVPADRIILKIEEDVFAEQAREVTGYGRDELSALLRHLADDRIDRSGPSASCMLARQHVPLERRRKLMGLLWDLSACDGVMHELEEAYIFFVSDLLDVPRKDTVAAREAARQRKRPGKPPPPRFAAASISELAATPKIRNPRSHSYL
jgi:uncharacterized tellurite resistance protein B-like protein